MLVVRPTFFLFSVSHFLLLFFLPAESFCQHGWSVIQRGDVRAVHACCPLSPRPLPSDHSPTDRRTAAFHFHADRCCCCCPCCHSSSGHVVHAPNNRTLRIIIGTFSVVAIFSTHLFIKNGTNRRTDRERHGAVGRTAAAMPHTAGACACADRSRFAVGVKCCQVMACTSIAANGPVGGESSGCRRRAVTRMDAVSISADWRLLLLRNGWRTKGVDC